MISAPQSHGVRGWGGDHKAQRPGPPDAGWGTAKRDPDWKSLEAGRIQHVKTGQVIRRTGAGWR